MTMDICKEGIDLIKKFEGFSDTPYKCPAGYDTIGYGHKIKSYENFACINHKEAEEILMNDLLVVKQSVLRYILVELNRNQFAALVSFTYNLGSSALQRSTLRQKINYGMSNQDVQSEFLRWIYAGGRVLPGLRMRRLAESLLYQM